MNGTELECDGEELRPDGMCAKCERVNERIEAKITTVRQEERRAAFSDAVQIIGKLVCPPQFEGNWRNGYSHAQNDAFRAVEAAATNENKGEAKDGPTDKG